MFVLLGCNGKQIIESELLLIKVLCSPFTSVTFSSFAPVGFFLRSDIPNNVTGSYKAESGILKASTTFYRGERKP